MKRLAVAAICILTIAACKKVNSAKGAAEQEKSAEAKPANAPTNANEAQQRRNPRANGQRRAPCRRPLINHCKGVDGYLDRYKCLSQKLDTINKACKQALEDSPFWADARAGKDKDLSPCRDALATHCKDANNYLGRYQCLREKGDTISEECRDKLDNSAHWEAARNGKQPARRGRRNGQPQKKG